MRISAGDAAPGSAYDRGVHRAAKAVALLAFLAAAQAIAPPVTPAQEPERERVAAREAGRTALANGDFERALALFREAFEAAGDPAILLEIGETADRLRRNGVALEAYERYLELAPWAPNRADIDARVRVLRRILPPLVWDWDLPRTSQPPPRTATPAGDRPEALGAPTPGASSDQRRRRARG